VTDILCCYNSTSTKPLKQETIRNKFVFKLVVLTVLVQSTMGDYVKEISILFMSFKVLVLFRGVIIVHEKCQVSVAQPKAV
jgi:Flp pilus assembly protein protease CpaA